MSVFRATSSAPWPVHGIRLPHGTRPAHGVRAVLALAVLALTAGSSSAQDSVLVHCEVWLDVNGDGIHQGHEPPLGDIRLTNGIEVFLTSVEGTADIWVDRSAYRFVTLVVPAGGWPSTPAWHWVPPSTSPSGTAVFGLRSNPVTAADPVRWVHLSDTHQNDMGNPPTFEDVLAEINRIPDAPACIVNTGDLVQRGSVPAHWDTYVAHLPLSDLPILHAVGNHDTVATATPLVEYEQRVGPPYYSLEMGSWHFVVWNSEAGSPRQAEWLVADIASAPAGANLALLNHRMSVGTDSATVELWLSQGIGAVFSGHWHCNQVTRRSSGLVDYNVPWPVYGAIDRTPRGFSLVTCAADGTIDYDLRRSGVVYRAFVAHPVEGQVVEDDTLPVFAQLYDTSIPVQEATAWITGPGPTRTVTLQPEGVSLWRGTLDLGGLPDGSYTVAVSGSFADGRGIYVLRDVELARALEAPAVVGEDWPMFRHDPSGASFTGQRLAPPLEVKWVAPVDGMVALSSPVVAGGKVLLGSRGERGPDGGGVAAFDALTGERLWYTQVTGGVALAPAVAGDIVVVNALADSIYGLDLSTGARQWAVAKENHFLDPTAPIVKGTKAWCGARPVARQIDWATGTVDWASQWLGTTFYPYIYSAPAVLSNSVLWGLYANPATSNTYGLVELDRLTGSATIWRDDGAWRSPIAVADTLFIVGGQLGAAQNPLQNASRRLSDETILWQASENLMKETTSPALGHGVLVTTGKPQGEGGEVYAYDASNGQLLWTFPVGYALFDMVLGLRGAASISSSPAIADDVVWIGGLDGRLYAIDLYDGTPLWNFRIGAPIASSPAISGDWLFVGASDGHLWAFAETDPGPATSVPGSGVAPARLGLGRPFPNPASRETAFEWSMPRDGDAQLTIHDVTGRRVRVLHQGPAEAGVHRAAWDGLDDGSRRIASGVYFLRLASDGRVETRKIVRISP